MQLKELKVGDKFYPSSMKMKSTPIYEVTDKHMGMSGRIRCKNLVDGNLINKLGKLEVIQINSYSKPVLVKKGKTF